MAGFIDGTKMFFVRNVEQHTCIAITPVMKRTHEHGSLTAFRRSHANRTMSASIHKRMELSLLVPRCKQWRAQVIDGEKAARLWQVMRQAD